ncbi:MAG: hypothetical protein AB1751_04320 [Acidobacteriota bacterium]
MTAKFGTQLVFFVAAAVAFGSQAQIAQFHEQVAVSALQVVVGFAGRVENVKPEDLEISLDGQNAKILSVTPFLLHNHQSLAALPAPIAGATNASVKERLPVIIILLPGLCDPRNLVLASKKLRDLIPHLEGSGPVTAIVADNPPRMVGPPAHTWSEVENLLNQLSQVKTTNWITRLRREQQGLAGTAWAARAERRLAQIEVYERARVSEEIVRLQRALDGLASALVSFARPRTLAFVIADGFDLDVHTRLKGTKGNKEPMDSIMPPLDRSPGLAIRSRLEQIGQLAAARGTVLVSLFTGLGTFFAPPWSAENKSLVRTEEVFSGEINSGLLVERPKEPLSVLAEYSGGTVLSMTEDAHKGMERLANTWIVEFQVPFLCEARHYRLLARLKRQEIEVRAPRIVWCGSSALQAQLEAIYGWGNMGSSAGSIPAAVRLERRSLAHEWLVVSSDLKKVISEEKALATLKLRVTVAVHLRKGEPFVHQEEFEQAVGEESEGTVWTYEAPIKLPNEAERLAVVIEELQTGTWGAAVLDLKGANP